jgi:peptidoglycan/LPS O-acetylase OafA/YrhL
MSRPTSRPIPDGRRFELLDFLRGVAAFAVLVYHSDTFLGTRLMPNAYLAVDLFFMLSGFVIAHSYAPKIAAGMSFREFTTQRLIRLYPCYALAFVLGFVLTTARMVRDNGYVDVWGLLVAGSANAVMLPALNHVYQEQVIFPFNGASWSLFYELLANVAYWFLLRRGLIGRKALTILLGASFVALTLVVIDSGSIDFGMRKGELAMGLPRVLFPFFAGVFIREYVYRQGEPRTNFVATLSIVGVMVVSLCFDAFLGAGSRGVAELVVVALVFPAIIALASGVAPETWLRPICSFWGNASYPVYILQTPMMFVVAATVGLLFHTRVPALAPYVGFVQVPLTVVLAWLVDRYFELPARNLLKKARQRTAKRASAEAAIRT